MPDLSGRTFDKMTIIGPAGPEHGPLPASATGWWVGECRCGRQVVAPGEAFLSGRIGSCGRPTAEDRAADARWIGDRTIPLRI